jgi:hypothetical protein
MNRPIALLAVVALIVLAIVVVVLFVPGQVSQRLGGPCTYETPPPSFCA